MDTNFASQIVTALKAQYNFRKVRGNWLQEGQCPDCGERELFTAAIDPKVLKCGRSNKCGFEISVRDALPDLFENWSNRFEKTDKDPNAAADAYLRYERGLFLTGLAGAYSQETYFDRTLNQSSETVRFPLPGGSHWERLIDRPGRFGKKAHFKFGGTWAGHCWAHPQDTFAVLAAMDQIWIAEGIFDALALRQNFTRLENTGSKRRRAAVSAMSVNTWPEHFLDELRKAIAASKNPKHRPEIIFAFDVGPAGVRFTRKFVERARQEGWDASAAQVRPDGDGTKLDWNDLLLRQSNWKGEDGKGPLDEDAIETYLWNGQVTIARSPTEKARLIHEKRHLASFYFRFENRIFWTRSKRDRDEGSFLDTEEVANCDFRILYRERDEATDETNYFLEIRFPNATPTAKARFSAACCAASGEFKKRLFAFSGMWSGSQEQLDRLMRDQTRQLKTVEPLHFTGYSESHNAWVLGDIAVHSGRLLNLSSERYFDIGKSAVKLRTEERILSITYNADNPDPVWVRDLWTAYGERGILTLAFFTMSLFAVQIRARHQSLGLLEMCGEAGSGKTTLIVFMWKLLGRMGYEGFDPNKGTIAGVARNFIKVSNLPVGLIESGRDEDQKAHRPKFDPDELLTLFNGRSPRVIGVKSGGTETFEPPFLGSIYLVQNEPIMARPAVLERLMSFRIDKGIQTEESRSAAHRLATAKIEDLSGWIVHVTKQADNWLKYFFERAAFHDTAMRKRVPDLNNDRIIHNHSQLCAAIETLSHLIPSNLLPDEWIRKTLALVDQIASQRQLSSGGDHPVVQRFWEIVDHLLGNETDTQWADGKSLNQARKPDILAINLVEFERRARSVGLQPPPDAELKKVLRTSQSHKFVGAKSVNNPAGKVVHCWVFENPNADSPLL